MDINFLRRLLAEGESSHLDYKSEQYRSSGASDGDKAELLKDILAMANAWRDTDAYILIGVQEQPGRKAEVVGVSTHPDDADLQQFVNSKTNRPIQFSYSSFEVEGKSIGIIHVPLQQRPFFLKKRFASLDADKVYLRRGSSTDIADADEVHSMGASSAAAAKPRLRVEFADVKNRTRFGQTFTLTREILQPPPTNRLPPPPSDGTGLIASLASVNGRANPKYWEELAEYLCLRSMVGRLGFAITNESSVVATDVRVELTTAAINEVLLLEYLPDRPQYRERVTFAAEDLVHRNFNPDVIFKRHGNLWHLEITFDKIQPRATAWTADELLIGTADERNVVLPGHIFGDTFEPTPIELRIASSPIIRTMTVKELREEHERRDEDEP